MRRKRTRPFSAECVRASALALVVGAMVTNVRHWQDEPGRPLHTPPSTTSASAEAPAHAFAPVPVPPGTAKVHLDLGWTEIPSDPV